VLAAVALLAWGCARGPDEAALRKEVEERLAKQVKPGLFEMQSLRRAGSSPLPAGESGAKRVIVYYNVALQLKQEYDFGGWEQLGPSSIAYALGATEKGVFGISGQNRAGDVVRAFGTATYELTGDRWVNVAGAASAVTPAPDAENTAAPTRSKQFLDKLASLVELPPPGVPPREDEIIAEELARASENIERRVARRKRIFTLASGPESGQYARFGAALIDAVAKAAPNVKLRQRTTQGSVENALLLARGEVDYAIIQSDIAARAIAGDAAFAGGATFANLRAVGSLFPEAVHIVVRADSPIRDVGELRGLRVDLGPSASGTYINALAVLGVHGIRPADLAEAAQDGPDKAIERFRRRQLDAFFVTIAAPAPPLQDLAARAGMRLLPLKTASIDRLVRENPGLVALTLPANTYPGQTAAVAAVAVTALLVATSDAPDSEVERVVDLVFVRMPAQAAGSAQTYKVAKQTALKGITIPLHPAASRTLK
jgi:TRAP transporter TAXI family solute receptor